MSNLDAGTSGLGILFLRCYISILSHILIAASRLAAFLERLVVNVARNLAVLDSSSVLANAIESVEPPGVRIGCTCFLLYGK